MASRKPARNPKFGFQQTRDDNPKTVHPSIFKQARKSGQLNLSGRSLTKVPDEVWRINIDVPEESKTVSLDNTDDRWWEQTDLTKLILASNWLTELSEDIKELSALSVLDIHDNRLESLPQAIRSLSNLVKLDVSRNRFKEFPSCISRCHSLVSLHIEHNELMHIGPEIGDLRKLEELDISNNQLTNLPPEIGYLTKVSRLNVSNNKLQSLPPELGCMDGLRFFDATHNQISVLPSDFGNLMHLEQLYLRHNKLQYLPLLSKCQNLKELHLGNNQLKELTAEHLNHLETLSVLDIRDNKVSVIPDEIVVLTGLQRLDLTNNDLTGLPYAMGTMTALKAVVLDGNPMKSIRRDIIMRGTTEIKKYLMSRMENTDIPVSNKGVHSGQGESGIIGGTGEGVNAHDICQSKTLDYSNKKTSDVSDDVWTVAQKGEITSVNLSKNAFTDIPPGMICLSEWLKELNMGMNRITVLNPDIGLYIKLTMLDLRNNQLTSLPNEMYSLFQLRELYISYNRFTSMPSVVYQLKKLENLFADTNKITQIDADGFKGLPMLATLDLQNNNIDQVPPELGNCTQIMSLQLNGNAFRNPRPAILAKGTLALLEYLRSRIVS
ncbi:leucine-rich repeat-containing protein 40-like [Mytilus galloprovincialis]|uniref:leucine-rich repeat-containing protein 40-like n=1 Tax=Mytilus galloprovincialis TaxID=29158 RepID=UPI003F7B64A9